MSDQDPRPLSPGNIHLQWFAAEDEGRTEDPTEYRIRKAREEGRVAKSQELIGALGLLLPTMTLVIVAPSMLKSLMDMLAFFITRATQLDPTREGGVLVLAFYRYLVSLVVPIAAVAVVSAIASNLVQVGPLFTLKPITPDFSKIVPHFGQYFKRTMFSMEGLYNVAKSLLKVAVIGLIGFLNLRVEFDKLVYLSNASLWHSVNFVSGVAARIILEAAVFMLAFSAVDYLFQRRQFTESLKMTKEEVKEERKMYEGDPLIKGKLRERMRELIGRNLSKAVPESTVVITNPTHYAVAIKYERQSMSAPMVQAKGADEVARTIKQLARDSGVPIVENKPLARALYAEAEVGELIPEKYYEALATVLAHVFQADARAKVRGGEAVNV